jgi:hypothetical protein
MQHEAASLHGRRERRLLINPWEPGGHGVAKLEHVTQPSGGGAGTAGEASNLVHVQEVVDASSDAPDLTTEAFSLGHVQEPAALRVWRVQRLRVPSAGGVRLRRRRMRGHGRQLQHRRRITIPLLLAVLDGFPDFLEPCFHRHEEAGELVVGETCKAWVAPCHGVVQQELGLARVVVAPRLLHLILEPVDLLLEVAFHVQHLLGLRPLRHGFEPLEDARCLCGRRRPRQRLWRALAEHHDAHVHVAQRRQLARLLQQVRTALPEGGAPGRVVGDQLQVHLIASHGENEETVTCK